MTTESRMETTKIITTTLTHAIHKIRKENKHFKYTMEMPYNNYQKQSVPPQRTLQKHRQLQTKPHPHQQRQLRYVYHHAHNNAPHELKHQALLLNNWHLHRTTHWHNLHRVSPYRFQRVIDPTRTTCHILDDQTIKNNCQEINTNPTKSRTIRISPPTCAMLNYITQEEMNAI